jgi:hypothetical protein
MMKVSFVVTCFVTCSFAIGAGCATTPVTVATQDAGDESPIVFDGALPDAPSCATPQCSSDLHTLYDGCGKILQTCPPDKGCSPEGQGSCVAPCDAAIANQTSVGCEYFTQKPFVAAGCWATFVANTWGSPVTISLDWNGQAVDVDKVAAIPMGTGASITYQPLVSGQIPPGQVAIVFMTSDVGSESSTLVYPSCPMAAASSIIDPAQIEMPFSPRIGRAFHLTTSAPVVAYGIHPYGGGGTHVTGSSLLLPTSAWGSNYITIAPQPLGNNTAPPKLVVVAGQDGTNVSLKANAPYAGGNGVAGGVKNATITYPLDKGQVLQIIGDLSGSPIKADKNIAVFGSQDGVNIGACCADDVFQQIPAVNALGFEHVGVRYRARDTADSEKSHWRIVGVADGTTLKWDPPFTGAPPVLSQGKVVDFDTAGPFYVTSQDSAHPFYLAEYMTGGNAFMYQGDPEMVTVVPPSQWLSSYVFFTDPTYPEANLVFVREFAPAGKDVTLDCYGVVDGWKTVGGSRFEYARIDLVRGNFEKQGQCDNGLHTAKSDGPFTVSIWGWGSQAAMPFDTLDTSYGYPAGAGVRPINTVVIPVN